MFGRRRFLDSDVEDWHIECWAWLLRCMGGVDRIRATPLILPSAEYFPPTDAEGHARAEHIFRCAQELGPMKDWYVELEAQQQLAGRVATFGQVQNQGDPCGTFRIENDVAIISYNPNELDNPVSLVATFGHELGHFLNGQFPEAPPGGWELCEPATDVTTTYLGFGIFGANSAFDYQQKQDFEAQSWSSMRRGYITEAEWVLDIAIFANLGRHDLSIAKTYLKPHLWSQLKKAVKYVEKRDLALSVMSYT